MTFYSLGRRFQPTFVLLVSPLLAGVYVFATARRRKVPLSNIYLFVCVAASAVIGSFPDLFRDKYNPPDNSWLIAKFVSAVRWIDDGFRGLLPLPFNSTLGGNAAAPPYFNNKNRASDEQYIRDLEACTFLVELQLDRPYPTRGSDLSTWEDELPVLRGLCWRVRVLALERVVPQRDGQPADTG
ncbi:dol-P-Man:Man(6)GlcNAc(2)-PP-Dol alpha-1,2-mannosyltransferase-like [Populus alba x Populus x berolinensis]|nr:dol-P-Man:Man(6)GlcNAc(2)-PP-Dol alpha-1,2-mannosyltransferase-like [Populus alba x Populus x berolinensis]